MKSNTCNMPPDYHLHTYLCKHAEGEPRQYLNAAIRKKVPELCFTDHAPAPDGYDLRNRMALNQFHQYTRLISGLKDNGTTEVLYGIEADYYHDCDKYQKKWLIEQDFDLVIGSIHYIKGWGFDNPDQRSVWDSVDVTNTWKEYFELLGRLAASRMYDIVAHLDLPKKFGYRPTDKSLKEMAQPALDKIAKAGMAIEINTSGLRRIVKEIYPSPLLLELARERNIPICFGSDSHKPDEVAYGFDKALKLVSQAGYTHSARFRKRNKELLPFQ